MALVFERKKPKRESKNAYKLRVCITHRVLHRYNDTQTASLSLKFIHLCPSVCDRIPTQVCAASATRRYTVKVSNGGKLRLLTFSVISTKSDSVGRLGA